MLKNKFFLLALFCFVGVFCANDSEQEESPTLFQKAKGCLTSTIYCPVTPFNITFLIAYFINKEHTYHPTVMILSKAKEIPILGSLLPGHKLVNFVLSGYLGYAASYPVSSDSSVNGNARLMGFCCGLFGSSILGNKTTR